MRSLCCAMALCLLFMGWGWTEERSLLCRLEEEIAAILKDNRQSVVRIHTLYPPRARADSGPFGSVFTHGTGFIFDPQGYILTIEAAIADADEIRVTLASGVQVRASLVGADPISGIAVIRVEAENLPTVVVGDSQHIEIGHYALLLGNDFGNLVPAVGMVHEIYRDTDLFQVSARVQSSYGGAPVFCGNGRVGGMVWRYEDPIRAVTQDKSPFFGWRPTPSSVFIIPINRAMRVARALVAHGQMAYGRLGVEVGLRGNEVVVLSVQPNSPATEGEIQPGDVVLSYRGRAVGGPEHLKRMVMESTPGETAMLGIRREGRVVATQVELDQMDKAALVALRPAPLIEPKDAAVYQHIGYLQREVGRLLQILNRQ